MPRAAAEKIFSYAYESRHVHGFYDARCELERLVELVSEILEMSKSRKKKQNEK